MSTDKKIGRPRPKEITERDKRVDKALRKLGTQNGVKMREIAEALDLTKDQVKYSLWRLRDQNKTERRNGYRWWPV